jgi:hypothetical protein
MEVAEPIKEQTALIEEGVSLLRTVVSSAKEAEATTALRRGIRDLMSRAKSFEGSIIGACLIVSAVRIGVESEPARPMLVSLVPSQLASGTVGPTKTLLKAVPGIVAGVATSPEAIDLLGHLLAVFAGKSFSEIIECIVRFPSGISGEVLGSMLRWYERNNSDISEDVIFEVAEIALKNQLGAAHQSDAAVCAWVAEKGIGRFFPLWAAAHDLRRMMAADAGMDSFLDWARGIDADTSSNGTFPAMVVSTVIEHVAGVGSAAADGARADSERDALSKYTPLLLSVIEIAGKTKINHRLCFKSAIHMCEELGWPSLGVPLVEDGVDMQAMGVRVCQLFLEKEVIPADIIKWALSSRQLSEDAKAQLAEWASARLES